MNTAAASTTDPDPVDPTADAPLGSCAVREFLWASSALALVVATCAGALSVWKTKRQSQQQHTHSRRALASRSALLWIACISTTSWGAAGIALSTETDCARRVGSNEQRWVVTLAAVVASASLVAAAALFVAAALASAQAVAPGREAPLAIICLRCSCCSVVMKRALLLAPMTLLAAVNAVSWRESVVLAHASDCRDETTLLATFFTGTTLLYVAVVVAQGVSIYCSSRNERHVATPAAASSQLTAVVAAGASSPQSASLTLRRRQRTVVFGALVLLSGASIAWAVYGWRAIATSATNRSSACSRTVLSSASMQTLQRSMAISIALLLLLGSVLLTLTVCCRLEDFIIASSSSSSGPTVDAAALSPSLGRSRATRDAGGRSSKEATLATAHRRADALV